MVDVIYYVRHKIGTGVLNSITLLSDDIEVKGSGKEKIKGVQDCRM